MIIRNAAKCIKCHDVIQSVHNHDYVECKCGAIAVDGGNSYLRAAGNVDDFIPLYVSTDKPFIPESAHLEHTDIILAAHHSETCAASILILF